MKELFDNTSQKISKLVTNEYSTSFSLGIRLLAPSVRPDIYAIYGFVRYADEIVDSFLDYDREELLADFEQDYRKALKHKISLNPVLNAFQQRVHKYELYDLVDAFLASMKLDLEKREYHTREEYQKYIFGSADVVGLMCLKVFVKGDKKHYEELKEPAQRLGSAFQKVNFLRDIKADTHTLGRNYFPELQLNELDHYSKQGIIQDIEADFQAAWIGLRKLPIEGRLGVYVAYRYYHKLLNKLKLKDSKEILRSRTRLSNEHKMWILFKSLVRYKLNML